MRLPSTPLLLSAAVLITALFSASLNALSKKEAAQAGAVLFRDKGCAYCHGIAGKGTAKGPSLDSVRKTMKPAQIADQIKNGGQKMPSFQDSLSDAEVLQLVEFLRAKHRPVPPPATEDPATSPAVSNPAQ